MPKFGGVCDASNQSLKKNAFTLAEVLITLAIIGVVASLVIPSVIRNYNDKKYNTARLKALKTFGEAGKMASINDEINGQPSARAFAENVLSKYLKITKICALANSTDCGFPSSIQPLNPATTPKLSTINLAKWNQIGARNGSYKRVSSPTNAAEMSVVVSTADGFSALIHYNPKCGRINGEITTKNPCDYKECNYYNVDAACLNAIYDMNGLKGPNHAGEDIGIVTVFWSGLKSTAVAPGIIPYSVNTTGTTTSNFANAPSICAQKGTAKIPYRMPNIDEISSLYLNKEVASLPQSGFWSSVPVVDRRGYAWRVVSGNDRMHDGVTGIFRVWCVRR